MVLFGTQNRTSGPSSAAINRIFISLMEFGGRPKGHVAAASLPYLHS
jgi:hypothetical protein